MVVQWVRLFAVLACVYAGCIGGSAAASSGTSTSTFAMGQDEGPLLPPIFDPDDDNDGVVDVDDSAPTDPDEGAPPPSGPTDPANDKDNDGLPDIMDPDDTNNGVPDEEEGVGTADEVIPAPAKPGTSAPVADAPVIRASGSSGGQSEELHIIALPSTGTGVESSSAILSLALAGGIFLITAIGIGRRIRRA